MGVVASLCAAGPQAIVEDAAPVEEAVPVEDATPVFDLSPVANPDYVRGCYNCGSLDHWLSQCPRPLTGITRCYQCGGEHVAWRCPQRGEPEEWGLSFTTVEANWGGDDGRYDCRTCGARWIRSRARIAPSVAQ